MEKDHFKDRSYHCKHSDMILVGDTSLICEKQAQKYASEIHHLTKIIVVRHLTNKKYHPMGIKLLGYKIRHNINPTPEQIEKVLKYYEKHKKLIDSGENKELSEKFIVGRGVYLLDKNGNIL